MSATSLYEPNFLASLKDDSQEDPHQEEELAMPPPPPPTAPSYPTALCPPVGPPYQPWDDPRYALPQMPVYKPMYVQQHHPHHQQHPHHLHHQQQQPQQQQQQQPQQQQHQQQHQQLPSHQIPQPAPAPEYYTPPPVCHPGNSSGSSQPSHHHQHQQHHSYHNPNFNSNSPLLPPMLTHAPSPSYLMQNPQMMHPQYHHAMQQQQHQYYQMHPSQQVSVPAFRPSNFQIPSLRRNNSAHNGTPSKRSTPALPPRQLSSLTPARVGLYEATYSNVPVYELASPNGVGVMRRKADSWMNATHILKAAGMEKSKRTKILEREIHQGEHEKIQGGYGKYQGTWIPLYRARELALEYGLGEALKALLDLPE